jgi:hypothetical protein
VYHAADFDAKTKRSQIASEAHMNKAHRLAVLVALFGLGLVVTAAPAAATDISGTISSTLTIFEDSQLVGDVTCEVVGAPCISFGAPDLTLELNGFTMTGRADALTPCSVSRPGEAGIAVSNQLRERILGPGLVHQFPQFGIRLLGSTRVTVRDVTLADNCNSGIFVVGGSRHRLEANLAVRNGHPTNPCGGI